MYIYTAVTSPLRLNILKILHVTSSLDPRLGGVAQSVKTLAIELTQQAFFSDILTLDEPVLHNVDGEKFSLHALGEGIGLWKYNSKLYSWLKMNIDQFDVLISHGLWQYHSYALWKVVKDLKKIKGNNKVPYVLVMPHGMLDPYFQRAKERRIKALRNWAYWKLIERKVINDADGLLFTCETEMLLARETFTGYRPKKEYNIGYGIETPPVYSELMSRAFNKVCPGLEGKPYLLFLSRIHPKKGIDLLLNAYIDLYIEASSGGSSVPRLVVAGPGLDSGFGRRMRQIVVKAGLESVIYFPGMLVSEAKWGAFYGCEAFVLPSHQENFGIAVAEALACGKAVLISNQVNIWREIITEAAGIIAADDQNGIKSMLKQWMDKTTLEKKEMGQRAFAVYKAHFTAEKITERLTVIINSEK